MSLSSNIQSKVIIQEAFAARNFYKQAGDDYHNLVLPIHQRTMPDLPIPLQRMDSAYLTLLTQSSGRNMREIPNLDGVLMSYTMVNVLWRWMDEIADEKELITNPNFKTTDFKHTPAFGDRSFGDLQHYLVEGTNQVFPGQEHRSQRWDFLKQVASMKPIFGQLMISAQTANPDHSVLPYHQAYQLKQHTTGDLGQLLARFYGQLTGLPDNQIQELENLSYSVFMATQFVDDLADWKSDWLKHGEKVAQKTGQVVQPVENLAICTLNETGPEGQEALQDLLLYPDNSVPNTRLFRVSSPQAWQAYKDRFKGELASFPLSPAGQYARDICAFAFRVSKYLPANYDLEKTDRHPTTKRILKTLVG